MESKQHTDEEYDDNLGGTEGNGILTAHMAGGLMEQQPKKKVTAAYNKQLMEMLNAQMQNAEESEEKMATLQMECNTLKEKMVYCCELYTIIVSRDVQLTSSSTFQL